MIRRRLGVAATAVAFDLAFGELPNRWHPVAWLGRGIAASEQRLPKATDEERRRSGLLLAVGFVGGALLTAVVARRQLRRSPAVLAFLGGALLLKQAFAIRALFRHAADIEQPLRKGSLDDARGAVGMMVSRPTADLPAHAVASAAIESLSENSSDSIVAPLLAYAVLGLPGALAYRAANTLDAVVGYREKGALGTPSARLDDALNLVPARATAVLIALASARPAPAATGALRDAGATPSPNSGWPMAATAHALNVRLEKAGHHVLNESGALPAAADIARARALMTRALAFGAVTAAAAMLFATRRSA